MIGTLAATFMMGSGLVFAGPLEDGQSAYNRGEDATELLRLRPLAEHGDAKAQTALGAMYATGKGVAQDYLEAVKWYRLAAVQGAATAQLLLGTMYQYGKGVAQDFVRAQMWYNIAAANGDANAKDMRDHVGQQRLTKDQIAEAQAMAQKCEASHYKACD